jgi:hypothetical protein
MTQGYISTLAIKLWGRIIYSFFASKSSFLVNGYRDYFKGGLNDMSSWVAKCWLDVQGWIVDGSNLSFCKTINLDYEFTASKRKKRSQEGLWSKTQTVIRQWKERKTARINTTGHDRITVILTLLKESFIQVKMKVHDELEHLSRKLKEPVLSCIASSKLIQIQDDEPFARFGHSLAAGDFDGDGVKKLGNLSKYPIIHSTQVFILAVGAPFSASAGGRVTVFRDILQKSISSILYPPFSKSHDQRFGYALAVVDLNRDGLDDLAVAAPSTKALEMEYQGAVYVYFGRNRTGLGSHPDLVIRPHVHQPKHEKGKIWENVFVNLGEKLFSYDIDGDGFLDLLIGSPHASTLPGKHQVGQLHAFLSSSDHKGKVKLDRSDWSLSGASDFSWFGSSVALWSPSSLSASYIIVSAPGHRSLTQGQGYIYVYLLNIRVKSTPELKFTIASGSEGASFGETMTVIKADSQDYLAISSPTAVTLIFLILTIVHPI